MKNFNFIMIFLDGVGIGEKDPEKNIFFKKKFNFLNSYFGSVPSLEMPVIENNDKYIFPLDALMGVEGLPQSGTGQTSLLCGVNAQKELGFHFGPFPHYSQIDLLKEKSLFAFFKQKRKKYYFANAYPKIYFEHLKKSSRIGAFALAYKLSGRVLNKSLELRRGKALSPEIDNSRWIEKLGYKLKRVTPQLAAKRLLRLASENDFVLYEYFFTDHLGHWRYKENLEIWMDVLDAFLSELLQSLDFKRTTLLIVSDHGNIEDMTVKTHTVNPAFCATAGKFSKLFFEKAKDLSDIKKVFETIYDS